MGKNLASFLMTGMLTASLIMGSGAVWAAETESQSAADLSEEFMVSSDLKEDEIRSMTENYLKTKTEKKGPAEQAICDYMLERNSKLYEPSDVTLCFIVDSGTTFDKDDKGEIMKVLANYHQYNYKIKDNTLVLASGGTSIGVFSLRSEDGDKTFKVVDAKFATDGDGQDEDIKKFCEEVGTDEEDYRKSFLVRDELLYENFIAYANAHPEIKSFEVDGKQVTVAEATEYIVQYWIDWYRNEE